MGRQSERFVKVRRKSCPTWGHGGVRGGEAIASQGLLRLLPRIAHGRHPLHERAGAQDALSGPDAGRPLADGPVLGMPRSIPQRPPAIPKYSYDDCWEEPLTRGHSFGNGVGLDAQSFSIHRTM